MRLRYSITLALVATIALAGSAIAATGLVATLSGAQEVGPNASPGIGNGIVVIDNAGTSLTYSVPFGGLVAPVTANHFHRAAFGVNGPVIFGIGQCIGLFSGTLAGTWPAMTPVQVSDMIAGLYYLNIHTTAFPGGEIRGQLFLDATKTNAATWGRIKQMYR
jgi:CHRD domain